MKKATIYKLSLWASICSFLIGFYLVLLENSIGDFLLGLGFIFAMIILVMGLKDIFSNKSIELSERIMWIIVFVLITPIAGTLYFPIYKNRIDESNGIQEKLYEEGQVENSNYSIDVL